MVSGPGDQEKVNPSSGESYAIIAEDSPIFLNIIRMFLLITSLLISSISHSSKRNQLLTLNPTHTSLTVKHSVRVPLFPSLLYLHLLPTCTSDCD